MSLSSSELQDRSQPVTRLAEPFEPSSTGDSTPRAPQELDDKKQKKRGLFSLGKKKAEEPARSPARSDAGAVSPARRQTKSTSPIRTEYPIHPSSPGRGLSSPRLASPAGSQIFERDVQESTSVVMPNSPAIPSHIQTENFIPPVLDASSEAITDQHLSPDDVEILTHTGHQPAALTVTGPGQLLSEGSGLAASWTDELAAFEAEQDHHDSASNYGSFDTTDIRRLSFISFADVVQGEQAGFGGMAGSRDSVYLAGLTSLASVGINRSPSPIRSPVSSAGIGTSPPTSKSGSIKGLELSPSRKPLGSPTSAYAIPLSPGGGGFGVAEVNVETMTQALRRTASTDLSGIRSAPTSPI